MKATVIVLAYRQQGFVLEALEAVRSQSIPPSEVIVVDDCSPDDTGKIIGDYVERYGRDWVFVRKENNGGVVAAVRSGLQNATGDVIIFAAGDDVSEPDRVRLTLDFFRDNSTIFGVVFGAAVMDRHGKILDKTVNPLARLPSRHEPQSLSKQDFLSGLYACGASSAFRRQVFDEFPPVREKAYADDRVYALRAILLGGCQFLPNIMVRWRAHGTNLSCLGGKKRGPHLSGHFHAWVQTFDQHLEDLDFFLARQEKYMGGNLVAFRSALELERSRYAVLEACHRPGLEIKAVTVASFHLLSLSGFNPLVLGRLLKPLLQMAIPYSVQRALARMRDLL
jgi:glycosyltransferase involved in cell wall biosynthesis